MILEHIINIGRELSTINNSTIFAFGYRCVYREFLMLECLAALFNDDYRSVFLNIQKDVAYIRRGLLHNKNNLVSEAFNNEKFIKQMASCEDESSRASPLIPIRIQEN